MWKKNLNTMFSWPDRWRWRAPGNWYIPFKGWDDDVPFPWVGYISSQEGTESIHPRKLTWMPKIMYIWIMFWKSFKHGNSWYQFIRVLECISCNFTWNSRTMTWLLSSHPWFQGHLKELNVQPNSSHGPRVQRPQSQITERKNTPEDDHETPRSWRFGVRWSPFSNRWFSGSMWIFQGVLLIWQERHDDVQLWVISQNSATEHVDLFQLLPKKITT